MSIKVWKICEKDKLKKNNNNNKIKEQKNKIRIIQIDLLLHFICNIMFLS